MGASETATGPRMTAAMHGPIFQQNRASALPIERARKFPATRGPSSLSAAGDRLASRSLQVNEEATCIERMNDAVLIAVKDDRRERTLGLARDLGANARAHHRQCGAQGCDISGRETRMDANGGVDLWIGRRDNSGGCASCGDAGDIDLRRIGLAGSDHVARQGRDNRWFTSTSLLMVRAMPVPATAKVRRPGLLRIKNEQAEFVGKLVHAGAGRELRGGLRAAVKHDHQRRPTPVRAFRRVQFVGQRAMGATELSVDKGSWLGPAWASRRRRAGRIGALRLCFGAFARRLGCRRHPLKGERD